LTDHFGYEKIFDFSVIHPVNRVIVQPAPLETSSYWYYCENPKGYYPYVKDCPYGWMKVVPEITASPTDK